MVHYRTHKRPPPVPILGQPNPVHIPTSHLLEIHPNIIHPSTPRSPQWSLSLRFPHQDPIHPLSSPILATCPAHLILLDFITRTILGEEYRSLSSSLCNLLHSSLTSSLLGPNILLNTIFSNTLSLCLCCYYCYIYIRGTLCLSVYAFQPWYTERILIKFGNVNLHLKFPVLQHATYYLPRTLKHGPFVYGYPVSLFLSGYDFLSIRVSTPPYINNKAVYSFCSPNTVL